MESLLLERASYRFQLAVQGMFSTDDDIILQVNYLMAKIRTPVMSTKLRRHKPLRPKLRHDTIWSGIFVMLPRHTQIRKCVVKMAELVPDAMLLNLALERKVDYTIDRLKALDKVIKKLHRLYPTILTARAFSDAVLKDYSSVCDRLTSDACIVHDQQFESGILKIQKHMRLY